MGKYIRFQFANILKSPTIYIVAFVLTPLLYVLTSAFIPAIMVIPGIMVFTIYVITFFVVGSSIFQTKQTSFLKRLSVLGITKSKFIISNAVVAITLSIATFYLFIELFGLLTAIANPFLIGLSEAKFADPNIGADSYVSGANVNFFVPQQFHLFFVDDIASTLDDAVWLMLGSLFNRLGEMQILDPSTLASILRAASTYFGVMFESNWEEGMGITINGIISTLYPGHDWVSAQDTSDWFSQLADDVEAGIEGPFYTISDKIMDLFYANSNHAPLDIVTDILISPTDHNESNDIIAIWNNNGQIEVNGGAYYRFWFYNDDHIGSHKGVMLYGNYAPTIGTILNPLINYDTHIEFTQFEALANRTMLFFWTVQFVLVIFVTVTIYFIMMLVNVFSINFEQYFVISGLFVLATLMFSGIFLPFAWILSTPFLYTIAIFLPSTAPIMLMSAISGDSIGLLGLQIEVPLENLFIYPIQICFVALTITMKMLSRDGGKLVTKFVHDPLSKKASLTNFVTSIIFFILTIILMFILVKQRDMWVHGVGSYYPSNFEVFVAIMITCIYALILFANYINWTSRSATFNRHRNAFALMNLLFLLPIGIITFVLTLKSKTIIANDRFESINKNADLFID